MRVLFLFIHLTATILFANAQPLKNRLAKAADKLEADPQMKFAIMGFCVMNSKTGEVLFERNSKKGLAPASTQKIITSVAAFDLLGKEFKYETTFRFVKAVQGNDSLILEVEPSGDPTLGSWRFPSTTRQAVLSSLRNALLKKGKIDLFKGVIVNNTGMGNPVPGGFTWEDMGNYYGAGCSQMNWHENQFDLSFTSGADGGTTLTKTVPDHSGYELTNLVISSPDVKGDEIIIYSAPEAKKITAEGRMPAQKKDFTVSGSMPNPSLSFLYELSDYCGDLFGPTNYLTRVRGNTPSQFQLPYYQYEDIYTHYSPPLDTINYYFLRRSINLYGEALIKYLVFSRTRFASTEAGVDFVKEYFASKGIPRAAINIIDGSGLSPQNRVTADALVRVLQYARSRSWYSSFYYSLPQYNDMKIKSGSIGGVRSFAGYHKATDGNEYTFSIIINNFDGSAAEMVDKIYKLLNILK